MRAIVYLLFCVILSSCVVESKMFERSFILKNATGQSINVKFYDLVSGEPTIITLGNNEDIEGVVDESEVRIDDIPNGSGGPISSFNVRQIDLIFSNETILQSTSSSEDNGQGFFSEPVQFNLLRNGNYQNIGNDQYLYTITQADYNAATPCDGPCE